MPHSGTDPCTVDGDAMSDAQQHPSESAGPLPLPRRTTPTWEIELLISGALVFSLFSLREPLEWAMLRWLPVATDGWRMLLVYAYLYGKMVLYTLLLTFSVHLAARARWVALVGVNSVYPRGPRWENLSGGPAARRVARQQCGDNVDDAIERADNQASLVFAFGILAAQMLLGIALLSLLVAGISSALNLLGASQALIWLFAALLVVPLLVAAGIDKWLLGRLPERHWLARCCEHVYRLSNVLILGHLAQPLMSLLTTNLGGKRGPYLLLGAIYLMMGLVAVDSISRLDQHGRIDLFSGKLPALQRDGDVLPAHYASLRRAEFRYSTAPFIQSEVIEGPYLKLVLPYVQERHNPVLEGDCASPVAADAEDRAARRAAEHQRIDCLGAQFQLRLDGEPLAGLDFERYRDPLSGNDALLSMIDVRDLPPGRHVLTVRRLLSAEEARDPDRDEDVDVAYQLVFWR